MVCKSCGYLFDVNSIAMPAVVGIPFMNPWDIHVIDLSCSMCGLPVRAEVQYATNREIFEIQGQTKRYGV